MKRAKLFFLAFSLLVLACVQKKGIEKIPIKEEVIPQKIAILLPQYKTEKGKKDFVAALIRGVLQNCLAGKGYVVLPLKRVDTVISSLSYDWRKAPPEKLCRDLRVDGLIYINILSSSMVFAVTFSFYKVDAEVIMVNKKGKRIGMFRESSQKRKVSLPTGPISAASVVFESFFSGSPKKNMRMVIYDWAWKISKDLPDCPYRQSLPKLVLVDTNVDKGLFGIGDRIEVKIEAENNLSCYFDIGDWQKNIPLSQVKDGEYFGFYAVKKGDSCTNIPLILHIMRPNGQERVWVEPEGTVEIDGISPDTPKNLFGYPTKVGIKLSWDVPKSFDIVSFVIERSKNPVGDFLKIGETKKNYFLDEKVRQGETYYYRVRAKDRAKNLSGYEKVLKVLFPIYEEQDIGGFLTKNLVCGRYVVTSDLTVPEGARVNIFGGASIKISEGKELIIRGTVIAKGEKKSPVSFFGKGWRGIVIEGGNLIIENAVISGCKECILLKDGFLEAKSIKIVGKVGEGFVSCTEKAAFTIKRSTIEGAYVGVLVKGGEGDVEYSTITKNEVGLKFFGGSLKLSKNNIYNNEMDILSSQKLVLEDNYLGTKEISEIRIKGDFILKSILDAPYPYGKKIELLSKKELRAEDVERNFKKYKHEGTIAFNSHRYGDAYTYLKRAISLKNDRDCYIYLAYTLAMLGEDKKLEKILEKSVKLFPYDYRVYLVYIKYLLEKGERDKALIFLEKALRMSPDNKSLIFIKKQYFPR